MYNLSNTIFLYMYYTFIISIPACHDEKVAQVAKSLGFKDVFYAKKRDTDGLTKTVMQAVDHAKTLMIERSGIKPVSG